MMSQKDYYNILGITKNATADVIKKAYRKLAHKHHPDKAGNTPEVNEKFQEISEAYETLSNPDKRSAYDNPFTGSKQNWNWQNTNPFQTGDFSSFFTGRSTTKETMINRGRNLNAHVSITLEEMMTGAIKKIRINRNAQCDSCKGTGAKNGETTNCFTCGGIGKINKTVHHTFGEIIIQDDCYTCKGSGTVSKDDCNSCRGTGLIRKDEELETSIPKGSINGVSYLVIGKGDWAKSPANPGDLIINIEEYLHPVYRRDGINLIHDKYLSFKDACLGTSIDIPDLKGSTLRIKIPAGTSAEKLFRLQGKGIPEFNGIGNGDILVKTYIKIPNELSDEQIKALKLFE
jgi:molecular chaperone DnaJ